MNFLPISRLGHTVIDNFRIKRIGIGSCFRKVLDITGHGFQNLVHPVVIQNHGIVASIQKALEQGRLNLQRRKHPLLERVFRYHIDYLNLTLLTDTIDTADSLLQYGRIPRNIQIYDKGCSLQVQTGTSCISRDKDPAIRLLPEITYENIALFRRHRSAKRRIADSSLIQFRGDKTCHPLPLAEHHYFLIPALDHIPDDVHRLIHLGIVSCFLVQNVRTVTNHPYLTKQQEHTFPVLVTQKMHASPFGNQLGHRHAETVMQFPLLRGHRHEQILVSPGRQLNLHVSLSAPYQTLLQPLPHDIEILVRHDFSAFVLDRSLLDELVIWSETELVHELHHGIKLFQLVFQRSSGQDYGIIRLNTPGRLGNLRVPVLESLNLIHYDTLSILVARLLHIIAQRMIRNNLIKRIGLIKFLALRRSALHYHGLRVGKPLYLFLPLILKRCRTQHHHRRNQTGLPHQFSRTDCLHSLSESHLISDNGLALPEREPDSLLLIRIQFRMKQIIEIGICQ